MPDAAHRGVEPRGPGPSELLLVAGRLWDGTGASIRRDMALVIRDGRVERVAPAAELHEWTGPRLETAGATVMPGLMDLHVHLVSVVDPDEPNAIWAEVGARTQLLTLHAAKNARLMLEAGFTTVRDLAGPINPLNLEVLALRRAIAIGLVPGPRIFAAGWVGQTGGHSDLPLPDAWPRDESVYADGPWAVRRLARAEIRLGVDLFKTSASGGAAGHKEELWWRNYTAEELAALVDEGHAVGKRVAVHSHTAEATKRALRAGVDTIEHGTELDEECLALFLETGAFMVPTISIRSERARAGRAAGRAPADVVRKYQRVAEVGDRWFRRACEAGVRMALGTDTYRSLRDHWGQNAYELELMVERGLSPAEALLTATRNAAAALGVEDRLGTLERGKLADLLVVDGEPDRDVRVLQDPARLLVVMREGRIALDRRASRSP
ncbi:MAG TPA: amidohydrolase family protein [Methylomirabilota bacterium]